MMGTNHSTFWNRYPCRWDECKFATCLEVACKPCQILQPVLSQILICRWHELPQRRSIWSFHPASKLSCRPFRAIACTSFPSMEMALVFLSFLSRLCWQLSLLKLVKTIISLVLNICHLVENVNLLPMLAKFGRKAWNKMAFRAMVAEQNPWNGFQRFCFGCFLKWLRSETGQRSLYGN